MCAQQILEVGEETEDSEIYGVTVSGSARSKGSVSTIVRMKQSQWIGLWANGIYSDVWAWGHLSRGLLTRLAYNCIIARRVWDHRPEESLPHLTNQL